MTHRITFRWMTAAAAASLIMGMLIVAAVGTARPSGKAGAAITAATTIRVSADSGEDGGRELSAMSADGRYTVFVGRSSATQGVYRYDARTGITTRLTTGNDMNPAISPDGRFVAFARYGSSRPVYMIDAATGVLTLESVASNGTPATGGSGSDFPSVSSNGRYVAFQTTATNLGGPTSSGGPTQIYVHDNVTGATTMVSLTSTGDAANGNVVMPDITPDGRYVAFASDAANLLPAGTTVPETGTVTQVYVRDMTAGTTTIASVSSAGVVGDGASAANNGPTISNDGHLVAFESDATNLVAGDTNGVEDAFVRDMTAGTTIRVSVDGSGGQAIPAPLPADVTDQTTPLVGGGNPQISGDGSTVAFDSQAPLTADDTNGVMDIYAYAMSTGAIERISVPVTGGTEASGTRLEGGGSTAGDTVEQVNGIDASISIDGRYVSFTSDGDLAADRAIPTETDTETSFEPAIFARTRNVPTVTGVSPGSAGQARNAQVLTITGTNFTPPSAPGDLSVSLGSGVTTTSVTWISSTELTATVDVAWNALLGSRVAGVVNPGDDVGSMPSAFTVTARGTGYRMAASDGGVFSFGDSGFYGSTGAMTLNKPVVGMADSNSGNGYWLVASDGGIFAFGDAGFYGSTGAMTLNKPVVGMAADHSGKGYWLVASDGGIFAFGDAGFYGSTGAMTLNKPVVGMAVTPDGGGYWLVASDGGIFAFGDAGFYGSTGAMTLNKPVVGMAASPDGGGYWLVASDGGIFAFGDAQFYGSTGAMTLNKPVVGMAAMPSGGGYWLVASDGGVFSFGTSTSYGSMGGTALNKPMVAMTAD